MCSLESSKLASCIGRWETVAKRVYPPNHEDDKAKKMTEKITKKMADTPHEDLSQAAARIVKEGCDLEVSKPSVSTGKRV
jgi:hypothetical protein